MFLTSTQNTTSITSKPVTCLLDYLHHNVQAKIAVFGITRRKAASMRYFFAQNSVHINVGLGEAVERLAGYVYPVLQPYSVRLHDCSHVGGFKNLIHGGIMPNQYTTKPSITELALIEASTTIGSIAESNAQFTSGFANYLDSLDKQLSEITVFELIDLLNKYRAVFNSKKTPAPKTSRFNILASGSKKVIADSLTYDQALQYRDPKKYVIKFAHMVGGASS